ncbi:MAG: hypothetical protein NVS3B20_14660 [Polyangiales bacterium]
MARLTLSPEKVAPTVAASVAQFKRSIVEQVAREVETAPLVVVGMAQNPFVKKARKLLEQENIAFKYLEFGSYLSQWKERLAIKLWAGFPTFPMVFRDGILIGGFSELEKLRVEGKLKTNSGTSSSS